MNRSIRRVALILGIAFFALFVNINIVQLAKSDQLSNHAKNRRLLVKEYATLRGEILAGEHVVAESVESENPTYRFARAYPQGELYGHITGYYSFFFGASGLERSYNDFLLGKEPQTAENFVDDLLGRETDGNVLALTIDHRLQQLARKALKGQRGAAAAIDPETGAVLALYGNPAYDPTPLSQDPANNVAIQDAWHALVNDPARPLTFAATQKVYPPGSTFKIITAAAGLTNGMTPTTSFPNPRRLDLPDTNRSLGNFGGGACPGGGSISIARGFRVSCNSTFAQIALRIGGEKLTETAELFGLNRPTDFDIPLARSCIVNLPGAGCDAPDLSRPGAAYSGIGQQDVRVTPLQMAVVAATVGNGGFRVKPHLVDRILAPDGGIIRRTEPQRERILTDKVAKQLRQMMVDTVKFGTGAVVGFNEARSGRIGGKTGTAETGIEDQAPHVWFVAFAPGIAVAVVVENGGDLGDAATGGRVAGPIAKALVDDFMKRNA